MEELKCGDVQVGDVFITDAGEGMHFYRIITSVGSPECFWVRCTTVFFQDGNFRSVNADEYFTFGATPEGWTHHRVPRPEGLSQAAPVVLAAMEYPEL